MKAMKLFPLCLRPMTLVASTTLLMAVALLPAQAAVISEILQRGQRSDSVRILQRELIRRGYLDASLETGVFGELTEAAVQGFQAQQGLTPDGIVGEATLRSLGLSGRGGDRISNQSLSRAEVQLLQARLVALKFEPGPVDGVAGPQTEQAIEDFQRDYEKPINPVVSTNTLEQISRVYERQLRLGSIRSVEDLNLPLPAATQNGPVTVVKIPRPRQEGMLGQVDFERDTANSRLSQPNWVDASSEVSAPTRSVRQSTRITREQLPRPVSAPVNSPAARPAWERGQDDSWNRSTVRPPQRNPSFNATAENPSSSPYIIAIPGESWALLSEVQAFSPSAFRSGSRRGPFIQAGAFSSRAEAEAEERYLRSKGFDARVVFTR